MAAAVARRVDADQIGKRQLLKSWAQPARCIRNNMSQLPLPPTIPGDQRTIESSNFAIQSDQSQTSTSAEPSTKKRKASRHKPPSDLKRSQSTPHMRGLAMADTSSISPTIDKRRNKLGYHRTSVACGHCRRRKIRCLLPTPEDPQGRCANCIRLKKECNFFPVNTDSTPQELRASSASRKGTLSGVPSTSRPASPQATATSNQVPPEDMRFSTLKQDLLPTSQPETFGVPSTNGQYPLTGYGYPTFQSQDGWATPGFSQGHAQVSNAQPEAGGSYWSPTHPSASAAYQASPTAATEAVPSTPFESSGFPYHQNPQNWVQPRSLSFGQIEGLQHHYPYPGLSSHHSSQVPSPAFPPYAPQLPSNHPSAPTTEPSTNALHTPSTTQQLPSYPYQPAWPPAYPQPVSLPSTHETHTGSFTNPQWYSESASVPKPGDPPSIPGSQYTNPPTYYSHVSHPG